MELYRQIIATLGREIENGIYPVGSELPSREELSRRFQVTRVTVNRAMAQLEQNGMIAARRGSGTVVINNQMRRRIALVAPEWLIHQRPSSESCRVYGIGYKEALASKTAIAALSGYDGILWSHPDDRLLPQIAGIMANVPGILINRTVDGYNYVGSDMEGCFESVVYERLARFENVPAYLLKSGVGSQFVHRNRDSGFVAACRKLKRFYEVIEMPHDFSGKLEVLENSLPRKNGEPLLVFADDWAESGALIQWVNRHGLKWREDIFYLDIDNQMPEHVWGLQTTSIMQDFYELTRQGLELLLKCLKQPDQPPIQKLIMPVLRNGDT